MHRECSDSQRVRTEPADRQPDVAKARPREAGAGLAQRRGIRARAEAYAWLLRWPLRAVLEHAP